jgi:lysyl-tRNA synthetase class 2
MHTELSDQEVIRRQKAEELRNLGIDPYPAALYEINVTAKDIRDNYERDKTNYKNISIAGRIMSVRDMGKACFAVIQDSTGRMQLYVRRDDICPGEDKSQYDVIFKKLLDIGDFIGVTGFVFTTKTSEISIHVTAFTVLSKALKPLPVVKTDESGKAFDEVTDPEFIYRQRYVDLIINPEVRERFRKRTQIVQ